jgi:hypothetical protein
VIGGGGDRRGDGEGSEVEEVRLCPYVHIRISGYGLGYEFGYGLDGLSCVWGGGGGLYRSRALS